MHVSIPSRPAPLTTGVTVPIPVGTMLVVDNDPSQVAEGFYAVPEEERLERVLIPEGDQRTEGYDGYSVVVSDTEVGDWIELIDE
jgi:hypothetical protein